ncbi:MAG TPA: hypothetical protein VGC25_09885 [Alphaproteobacteria bacterium]
MDDRQMLFSIYSEASTYDTHYSSVRTATSTFLMSVGLGLGSFFLVREMRSPALFIPGLVFLFALMLNLHFQKLTWCCRRIQEELERQIKGTGPPNEDHGSFRRNLRARFKHEAQLYFDTPAVLLVIFILLYFVVTGAFVHFREAADIARVTLLLLPGVVLAVGLMKLWNLLVRRFQRRRDGRLQQFRRSLKVVLSMIFLYTSLVAYLAFDYYVEAHSIIVRQTIALVVSLWGGVATS